MKNSSPILVASLMLLAASAQGCTPAPQPPQPAQTRTATTANDQRQQWLEPTGNAELDELRRLAVQAPIDDLMSRAPVFIDLMYRDYSNDLALWSGAERIAAELLANTDIKQRRVQSRWLAQVIEGADPAVTTALRPRVAELRRVP